MTIDPDSRFRTKFLHPIRDEGPDQFGELMGTDPSWEVPLYSWFARSEFLEPPGASEENRVLIRATAARAVKAIEQSRDFCADRPYDYV